MATASNTTPPPHHSPRASAAGGQPAAAVSSPKSRRSSTPRGGVSSPWTQIVRGAESEAPPSSSTSNTTAAATTVAVVTSADVSPPSLSPSSSVAFPEQIANAPSDWSATKTMAVAGAGGSSSSSLNEEAVAEAHLDSSENGGSSDAGKKPAWNRPSNGAADVSPVMGAVSWPALSESTKASPKSSSSDSLKNLSDGLISVPQGIGMGSSSSPRQVSSNHTSLNSTPNHVAPTRQRPMKRGGGGSNSASANGGFLQAPPPQGVVEVAPNSSGKTGHSSGESSSRDNTHKEVGQRGGFGSQLHSGGEHQQRSSFRRGSGGPHPRGDGSHHHNYGGRRDHDRGNQDWNSQRNFGGRDAHMQPQRGPSRPFIQGPPHANTPYVPPPPITVRPPFGTPMVYPEVPSPVFYVPGPHPDSFRGVPMVAPMPPVFIPLADPHLPMKIVNQIEYYFSNENLVKDTYLRQNMDEQGWVPIKLIANFKKVRQLTEDIQLILAVLQSSSVVEVEGEKVRRRDDWTKWIIPRSVQYSTLSSPQSFQKSGHDMLAEHLQSVTLDEKKTRNFHAEEYPSRSSSGEFSSQSHQSGNEMSGIVTMQSGQPTLATSK